MEPIPDICAQLVEKPVPVNRKRHLVALHQALDVPLLMQPREHKKPVD